MISITKYQTVSLIVAFFILTISAETHFYSPTTTDDTEIDKRTGNPASMLCMNILRQQTVNVEHITGRWYGNEIIMHTQDVPGIYRYDTCVIIHINDITAQMRGYAYNYNVHTRDDLRQTSLNVESTDMVEQRQRQRQSIYAKQTPTKYIRLVWAEKDENLEYTFNYTDVSPGYWMNVGEQRGSLVAQSYTQFTGSVQVVKAVNNHLVLTFCGHDVHSTIYTIVLSRTPKGLTADELRSIRNLLSRRGLAADSIRQVCDSGAARLSSTALIAMLFMFLLNKMRAK